MSEAQRLEALAERLRAVDPVMPSPATKIRGWNLVSAAVQQSSTARSPRYSVRRLVLAVAAAGVLLAVGTVAASADSLPDSPLYPIRGAVEQARGLLAFSPTDKLTYHLDLAQARLRDAEAMIARHRVDLADIALNQLDDQLSEAAQVVADEGQTDPVLAADMQNRLQQAIAVHDRQLAGLQGEVTNPTAQAAIADARARAAQALQQASNPSSNGIRTDASGRAQGTGTSATPHPTPKK